MNGADLVLTTECVFASFGRMRSLTHPDATKVEYGYDAGGRVQRVFLSGLTVASPPVRTYVDDIRYNE